MKVLQVVAGLVILPALMFFNVAIASADCVGAADGTACNDGNPCTINDTCQAGVCVGTPVANGTACSDGNACTQTDTCQSGVCVGSNPVVCTAKDQCHVAGTCDPTTGACSNPQAPDGTACSDGNACTQTDTCQNGSCVGGNPVVCTALDQCHVAGTCNPATGACSNPAAPDGTACSDGNACTQTDTCQAGSCVGGNPVVCTALDQCHVAGTCDPVTGACSNPAVPDGTACSDGNACTQTDTCQAGSCIGGTSVVCSALDQCHLAGTCDPSSGVCSNPPNPSFNVVGGSVFAQPSLELAYDTLQSGETMEVQALAFAENAVLQKDLTVTLVGGYTCDFTSDSGFTTIDGSLTIGNGTVVLDNFVIQ